MNMTKCSLLFTVCLMLSSTYFPFISAETVYITPSTSIPCPTFIFAPPCTTLSQYAANPNMLDNNIDLILLPGRHNLTSNFVFQDRNIITQILMMAQDPSAETVVRCSNEVRFRFVSVSSVSISDIHFEGCVGNLFALVTQLVIQRCDLNGLNQNGTGMHLESVINVTIIDTIFTSNTGGSTNDPFSMLPISGGGAMVIFDSIVRFYNLTFQSNTASQGGAIFILRSDMLINQCTFFNNVADSNGGGIYAGFTALYVFNTNFTNNFANGDKGYGGAIEVLLNSTTVISETIFFGNTASFGGGAIDTFGTDGINISDSQFFQNRAEIGSAVYIESDNMMSSSLTFMNNTADTSVMHIIKSKVIIGGNTTVSNNIGSVFSFASNITFSGYTYFLFNSHPTTSQLLQEGGAMTSFQSTIFFVDTTFFLHNTAKIGGAITAKESKIYMYGAINVSHNVATRSGGGIFLYQSELTFNGTAEVVNNTAATDGGGFHCVSSTTSVIDGSVWIAKNRAEQNGGAMYLELNAKLYIAKYQSECIDRILCNNKDNETWVKLEIAENTADYGGALYVADDTNSGTCDSVPFQSQFTAAECFFQALALHSVTLPNLNIINTYFINNTANIDGDTIYGGLLDRCKVSSFSEIFRLTRYSESSPVDIDAISYLLDVTNIQREELQREVKSDAVRICFCKDNKPDCSFQPSTIYARRGESITVSLVAVDQVNNTVNDSLIAAYLSDQLGLSDGQSFQTTSEAGTCSELPYNIFSSLETDTLSLFATGPCDDIGISAANINITILPCPPGFTSTGTECVCDDTLSRDFITNCSVDTGLVMRVGNVWVSVINATAEEKRYITYPNCPFDYCLPSDENIYIDLSAENGSDVVCAFNRTGQLCGACDRTKNLSHAFGSSRCLPCSSNWLALFIPFILAGIALVGFILLCNLTVAVGSIDALIFYANIVGVNRSILLPFERANFLTIFIAWLNLDVGFETCFYDGLDEYAKVWLQFVFPMYIIFLVAMVIIISKYSRYFAKLLSKRHPIATLATLVLLSFTKLVRAVIASLSPVRLNFRGNGTVEEVKLVWLVDGNVPYLAGKHIPLFIVAVVSFVVILVYVMLLFSWQWLLRCPNRRYLRWIRDVRFNSIMDAYNAPFTRRHRYWTGLLLIARGILYINLALNVFGDPKAPLYAIVVVVGSLFLLKEIVKRRIHKKRFLNLLEGVFLYNLLIFAATSLYLDENSGSRIALAYTSTSIAFALFIFILIYHVYTYIFMSFTPLRKFIDSFKSHNLKHSKRGKHATETGTDRTVPLLSGEYDEFGHQQDFSKFRGPLELLDTHSFSESQSNQEYTPPQSGDLDTQESNQQRSVRVTYSVVDPIPSENDMNAMEQSMTQM